MKKHYNNLFTQNKQILFGMPARLVFNDLPPATFQELEKQQPPKQPIEMTAKEVEKVEVGNKKTIHATLLAAIEGGRKEIEKTLRQIAEEQKTEEQKAKEQESIILEIPPC